jgi:hypothetical protein
MCRRRRRICSQTQKARIFFSEEKKQKTFIFWCCAKIPAMAWIVGEAQE